PKRYTTVASPGILKAGDFNGDGFKDLAVGNDELGGGISFHRNKGDGTFSFREVYGRGMTLRALRAADLDGDRDQDLVCLAEVPEGQTVVVMTNPGDGKLFVEPNPPIYGYFSSLTTADMDGDLKEDLILSRAAEVIVLFSARDGSVPRQTRIG